MASQILTAARRSNPVGNVAYINHSHLQEAQRIALHTTAANALAVASWNLNSDAGSIAQAIAKSESATAALRRLQQIGGAA